MGNHKNRPSFAARARAGYQKLSESMYRALSLLSPAWNSRLRWKKFYGFPLNLKNPVTFNEKIMFLKLRYYNDSPAVKRLAHKALARKFVEDRGLRDILPDCYGVWNAVDDIPWGTLPDRFIVKTALGCGSHVICRDRRAFDTEAAAQTLQRTWSSRDYLLYSELQYRPARYAPQQALCERLLDTEGGAAPDDFKLYCYHGEPRYILYCFDRGSDGHAKFMMFDTDWNYLPRLLKDRYEPVPARPSSLGRMLEIARTLSAGFPFVRVDLYEEHGKPIFGELTFTPSGALDDDYTPEGARMLGEPLDVGSVDREALK